MSDTSPLTDSTHAAVIAHALTRYRQGDPSGAAADLSADLDALPAPLPGDADPYAHLHCLALHLLALLRCEASDVPGAVRALGVATKLELSARYKNAAEHTSHAGQLFQHLKGNLSEARAYYRSTLNSAAQSNNTPGVALTLRALGTLALLIGKADQAQACWARSQQQMTDLGWPEAAALSTWASASAALRDPTP